MAPRRGRVALILALCGMGLTGSPAPTRARDVRPWLVPERLTAARAESHAFPIIAASHRGRKISLKIPLHLFCSSAEMCRKFEVKCRSNRAFV